MSKVAAVAACVYLLACGIVAPAWGQEPVAPERDTFWLGVGLGVGSEDAAGSINGSYQFGASVISLRAGVTAGPYDDGFIDYAVLYGRATRPAGKKYHASAGLGIGLLDGCEREGGLSDCSGVSTVLGLPLELQASWRPGSLVGLALYGFANLNGTRSIAGLTLGLQVGRLR